MRFPEAYCVQLIPDAFQLLEFGLKLLRNPCSLSLTRFGFWSSA
jgi:hypothetical protein